MKLFFIVTLILLLYSSRRYLFTRENAMDGWFLATLTTFCFVTILSWALMRAGSYSIVTVTAVLLVVSAVLYYFRQPKVEVICDMPQENASHLAIVLVVLLSFGVLYALYPTYYLSGGRDPVLYLISAVHIAKTGGLNFDLPFLQDLYAQYGNTIWFDYPGIYSALSRGLSTDPNVLIPQFMHLFPSFAANLYCFGELEGVVRANSIVAVMALWSFFMVAHRLMNFWPALLATAALGINPAIIWNARITLTEVLSLSMLFFGLYLLFIANERSSVRWAVAAGLLLGCSVLNRLDAALNVFVIIGFTLYAVLADDKTRRVAFGLICSYACGSTLGFIDGYLHTYPYVYDLWLLGILKKLFFLNYGGIVGSIGLLTIPRSFQEKLFLTRYTLRSAVIALSFALGIWLLFAYTVRPVWDESFSGRAARELGWYVTPLSFIGFPLGLGFILYKKNGWDVWLPLLFLAAVSVFAFTWNPAITPDHIWASRRWVPQVIPVLLLFSCYAVWQCSCFINPRTVWLRRGIWILVAGLYLVSAVHFARPYLFTPMLSDYPAGYQRLVNRLKKEHDERINLTRNGEIAAVLTYIYGVNTIFLRSVTLDQLQQAIAGGYRFIGTNVSAFRLIGNNLSPPFTKWEVEGMEEICGLFLEKVTGVQPQKLYEQCLSIDIVGPASNLRINLPGAHGRFGTQVGIRDREKGTLMSNGHKGYVQFGPYQALNAGRYTVEWFGTVQAARGRGDGFVDVCINKGHSIIKHDPLKLVINNLSKAHPIARIDFVLDKPVEDLEFRLYVEEGIYLTLQNVILSDQSSS